MGVVVVVGFIGIEAYRYLARMPDDWVGHPLRRDYPVGGEVVEFSEEHERWQTAPEKA